MSSLAKGGSMETLEPPLNLPLTIELSTPWHEHWQYCFVISKIQSLYYRSSEKSCHNDNIQQLESKFHMDVLSFCLRRLQPWPIKLAHEFHTGSNSCSELKYCGNRVSSMCLWWCSSVVGRAVVVPNCQLLCTSPSPPHQKMTLANFKAKVGTLLRHIRLGLLWITVFGNKFCLVYIRRRQRSLSYRAKFPSTLSHTKIK